MKQRWLRFWAGWLPAVGREVLEAENRRLREALARQQAECERLQAYLDGMRAALRAGRQVKIYNGTGREEGRHEGTV